MTTLDRLTLYISLFAGALLGFYSRAGLSYLHDGDYARGLFYLALSVFTVVGLIGPYVPSFRVAGANAARIVIFLFVFWSAWNYVKERFVPHLPRL